MPVHHDIADKRISKAETLLQLFGAPDNEITGERNTH
jgi:hypothetical protein